METGKYVPNIGDYVLLGGEYREITDVHLYNTGGNYISVKNYADHYIQDWHVYVPKEIYESPLYRALL